MLISDHGMHMKNLISAYVSDEGPLIEAQLPMLYVLIDNNLLT
jgi:hypothetical protein